MSDAFQPGDVVRLKSGGPLMTVEITDGDDVGVRWFDTTSRLRSEFVSPSVLVKVEQFPETTPRTVLDFSPPNIGDNLTLGEHTVTITGVEPLGDHGAQTLTVTGYGESELARRTRLAVQHVAEKYCVGKDAVKVCGRKNSPFSNDLPNTQSWQMTPRICPCGMKVAMQVVRDLDGFAYARGRCTECNRVYVAVEPVA